MWALYQQWIAGQQQTLSARAGGQQGQGRFFRPSDRPGIHLWTHGGPAAGQLAQALAAKGRLAWAAGGFVNVRWQPLVLRQALAGLWRQGAATDWNCVAWDCDFSPLPYACARLRMELWTLRNASQAAFCLPEGAEELAWRLLSLPAWPPSQQPRKQLELARLLVDTLDGQVCRGEDAARWLPLWQVHHALLSEMQKYR